MSTSISRHFYQHQSIYLRAVVALCAATLILLFILTGLGKVVEVEVFKSQLKKQPLPAWSKPQLVYLLPVIELGIVTLFLFRKSRQLAFGVASLLLLSYSIYAYLAYIEIYGYVVCACGKIFQQMNWRDHFWVNSGLTLIALTGYYASRKLRAAPT